MNEQQLAAVKQALEALETAWTYDEDNADGYYFGAIEAIKQVIAQDALDKKADNARELGLSYDTPLSSFVRSSDEAKAEVMERVIDKAIEAQKEKIGCVNHDCDKCKAVQEPWVGLSEDEIKKLRHLIDWTAEWSYGRFAYELERLLREKNGGAV
jgi:hypothetical protein